MVNIKSKKCKTEGCGKQPSFGVAGTKRVEYCAQQASDKTIVVKNRKCKTHGCGKWLTFGLGGRKTAEYCSQHTPDRKCGTGGCGEKPSFGVANTITAEYCAQHVRIEYDVEEYTEREVVPHHSRKEIVDDVIPYDRKHKTVHSPPAHGSPSSGGSRGFRRQVQHSEMKSSASK